MENNNNQNNRRNFLKKSLVGAASLSVLPSLNVAGQQQKSDEKKNGIIYRTLGRTGIKVPVVSMGTSNNDYIIKAAISSGFFHYDTGNTYGNGADEAAFGRAFKGKPRESFNIATKIVGMRDRGNGMPLSNVSSKEFVDDFKKKFEQSLKRLQMDYVDILYLHSADVIEVVKLNMIKDVMLEFKNSGKAKFLGVSTHNLDVVYPVVEEKIYDVVLVPYNFRDENNAGKKAIAHAAKAGLGIVGMKALAGGFWDNERKQRINPKAAVKWTLNDENMHTMLVSVNDFEQLETYSSIMSDITMTKEEKDDLKLGQQLGAKGIYCINCGECKKQCPYNEEIPTIMRSYMYAYGYKKPLMAKETLLASGIEKVKCSDCLSCNIDCTMGFNIRKKSIDISRVLDIPSDFLA